MSGNPMNGKSGLSRFVLGLLACAISLKLLEQALPHVLLPLIVLAVIFVIVRLVIFHTQR